MNAKAGYAQGAADPDFDDTAWREVELPHDWVVEQPFDSSANVSQGYRKRGIAWYRRRFALDPADRGKHLEIQLDGVATYCTVWLNGSVIHRNWCGYTSFYLDVTDLARFGDSLNTLVVRVDADAMEGWWYEGGGIYRHTWLVKRSPVHIVTDGVHANPVRHSEDRWSLPVEVTLENIGGEGSGVEVESILIDPDGFEVVRERTVAHVPSLGRATCELELNVTAPRLWSVDQPTLYSCRTRILDGDNSIDEVTTACGFRTLKFDPERGFFLNDTHMKLQGVCNHQDHAGVGVAVPDSLWDFRIRRLKEMGVNAYRCAHNPPAAEFLDACDRLGMLVMDENRVFNTSPEYMRQLEWLVRRDRNHPSVILWSVFNEEPMQGTEAGYEMVRRMTAVVKRLDPNRPVTAAMNGGLFNPVNVSQSVDVVGFNYQIDSYDAFHAANPDLPVTSSEDTSAFMTRGEYETDDARQIKDSYDTQFAPWGASHRRAWKAIATRPYLAGGFVWTGFDYRGEPTPYQWPSAGSFFGIMDQCGFPKAAFFLHQAQWVQVRPILQLIPHWNWPGREGQLVRVEALTNVEEVSLALNGSSFERKAADPYEMVSWEIPYAPGKLEAVGYVGGMEVTRCAVETTSEPVILRLTADRETLAGDGWDATPVTVEALDVQGRPVPTANLMVRFELAGPGSIIGLGNGDPNSHEPEKGDRRSLFNGLAQVILQSAHDSSGVLILQAHAPGLQSTETRVTVDPAEPRPFVPITEAIQQLDHWRMSPVSATALDPNQALADSDQNSWQRIHPGRLDSFEGGRYAIFRARFRPYEKVRAIGGRLSFAGVVGIAEFWLDGTKVQTKDNSAESSVVIDLPPGEGERTLSILVQVDDGFDAGLSGPVVVQPCQP